MGEWEFGDPILPPRFWDKVFPEPMTGCWLWGASTNKQGYGQLIWGSKKDGSKRPWLAHRLAFGHLKEVLDPSLVLDHLCRTSSCVNPDHLEQVTNKKNTDRGLAKLNGEYNRIKTHCPQGHPYAGENLRVITTRKRAPYRLCKTCQARRKGDWL